MMGVLEKGWVMWPQGTLNILAVNLLLELPLLAAHPLLERIFVTVVLQYQKKK